jgi:hypothetical protein
MIPFSPPRIDQKIVDAVVETLHSGWISTGPRTKLFEKKITDDNWSIASMLHFLSHHVRTIDFVHCSLGLLGSLVKID